MSEEFLNSETTNNFNEYIVGDSLSSGSFGNVYNFTNSYVIKFLKNFREYEIIKKEIQNFKHVNEILPDITVKYMGLVKRKHENQEQFGIVMEKLDGTLYELLQICDEDNIENIFNDILYLLNRMCSTNLAHNDFTIYNIGYKRNDDNEICLKMIDFDFVTRNRCFPLIELLTLYNNIPGGLYTSFKNKIKNYIEELEMDFEDFDDLNSYYNESLNTGENRMRNENNLGVNNIESDKNNSCSSYLPPQKKIKKEHEKKSEKKVVGFSFSLKEPSSGVVLLGDGSKKKRKSRSKKRHKKIKSKLKKKSKKKF